MHLVMSNKVHIYLASTPWMSSRAIRKDIIKQTPHNKGVWNNLVIVKSLKQADFVIIQDDTEEWPTIKCFAKERILYFSREALDNQSIKKYSDNDVTKFSYWNKTGYLYTKWVYHEPLKVKLRKYFSFRFTPGYNGLGLDYSSILERPIDTLRSKRICAILSNTQITEGHKLRLEFTNKLLKKYSFDLYGNVTFSNSEISRTDKYKVLEKYQYCLSFDNQDTIEDFFGTQFTDAILAGCCPIYWGGAKLEKYFPKDSFIQIDIRKKECIDDVIEILNRDDFNKRIPAINIARKLLLDKYNLLPTIETIINK